MKLIHAALLALTVTGCASTPVPVTQAVNVPVDRYFWTEQVKSKTPGKLVVVRDDGFAGMGVQANVSIDQRPLAALAMGEKVEVALDPDSDEYVIYVNVGGSGGSNTSANQLIRAGLTYFYHIVTDNDAYIHLLRVKKPD